VRASGGRVAGPLVAAAVPGFSYNELADSCRPMWWPR